MAPGWIRFLLPLFLLPACIDGDPGGSSASQAATAQSVLVARAATWSYWNHGEDLGTTWTQHDWIPTASPTTGTAPLGYGESYVNSIDYGPDPAHKPITVYFRKAFFVDDPGRVASMRFEAMYDDGFVYYVNGVEGGRGSMPVGAITATTLSTGHEAEASYLSFDATALIGALHAGWNTLAVEIHQAAPSSSDLVFDASLVAQIEDGPPPPAIGSISKRSTWSYWDRGGDLGTAWRAGAYDASSWRSGAGPLGYGESYLGTPIGSGPTPSAKYITTYFRRQFTVADPAEVGDLTGELMYDDGVVVYLNGQEIARAAMPAGTITATTLAAGHEASDSYQSFDWSSHRGLLVAGVNTLAVEVHQQAASSSDLVFDLALTLHAAPPPPTQIARRSIWRYWDRGGDLGTAWRAPGYADGAWPSGAAPLGYGESYLATTIGYGPSTTDRYVTSYFRAELQVDDPTAVTTLTGELMYDDGLVVYLNDHEIGRAAMPVGPVTAATLSTGHEAGNAYESFDWSAQKAWLVTGRNTIAVEVHQSARSSSDLVFDLALHVGSGATGPDGDGDRLRDEVETGTGIFRGASDTGTSPTDPDTDGDGLDDGDEVLGTAGGLDLPALGVRPTHKDILLEYDWFDDGNECGAHSHRPTAGAVQRVTDAFAASDVANPDGVPGVHVIHDYGQGGPFTGGNWIADADGVLTGFFDAEYQGYRSANFAADRQGYFHYVLMPHRHDTSSGSSGFAEIVGDDMIVSLYCSHGDVSVGNTIMHELGHNLGLHHGGAGDATNYKPNYNSVMNYLYQFSGVDTNCTPPGDGLLDYSRHDHIDLDEHALSEAAGICGAVAWDWDQDGAIDAASVSRDLNFDAALSTLTDRDDWASLVYDFAPGGAAGLSVFSEVVTCDNPAP